MSSIHAVRVHGKDDLRVELIEEPTPPPAGYVTLVGGFSGICETDLSLIHQPEFYRQAYGWDFDTPHKVTGGTWPQVLGHEFSGVVAAVGEGVVEPKVGDRVAVFTMHYCGECDACQRGRYTSCPFTTSDGIQSPAGGMAQARNVRADKCFVLPEAVDLRLGALVEPMAISWNAVDLAQPTPQSTALILGADTIGIGALFALRDRGAVRILVSESNPERRAAVKALGADVVIDPASENLVDVVLEQTGGSGVDIVVDCAGVAAAVPDALRSMAPGGRMVIAAMYAEPVPVPSYFLTEDRSLRASMAYSQETYRQVIDAMARGAFRVGDEWVHVVGFEQVDEAVAQLSRGEGTKVLVEVAGP